MEKCGLEFYSSLNLRCPVSLAGCPAALDNALSEFPIFQNLVLVKIGGGANHFESNFKPLHSELKLIHLVVPHNISIDVLSSSSPGFG
jgi:hypothetical protein